jgi:hypothetical protein
VSRSEPSPKWFSWCAPAGGSPGTRRRDAASGNARRSPRGIHDPVSRSVQNIKKISKVKNLKGVTLVSREIGCARQVVCPGAPATRSACDRVGKACEGQWVLDLLGVHPAWRARNLGGAEPQGGIRLGFWLNPKTHVRDPWNEQSPGATVLASSLVSNRVRVTALERAHGVSGGERPRRENPKSGTGMKQAQQVTRGARRRRGAKPQGRNLTREVEAHGR